MAKTVKAAAMRSYRLGHTMVEPVNLVLTSSPTTIRALSGQIKPLNKAIATQLKAAPAQTLETIPGMGPVLVSGIVAEIGDITRFKSEEQVAKFAGLTWRRYQSGEFEGDDRPLPRRETPTFATT